MIDWLSLFIQFNPPDNRIKWRLIWGSSDTFVWTPLFKFHWRRMILFSAKWHVVAWIKNKDPRRIAGA